MPKITSLAQQHRHHIGDHTAREDAKQRTQVAQDDFTRKLADRPGLNRGNVQQQQNAATLLQVFSYLTTVRNAPATMVDPPFLGRSQQDMPVGPSAGGTAKTEVTSSWPVLGGVKDVLVKVGNFVDQIDPLKFPGAEAAPIPDGYTPGLFNVPGRLRREAPDEYAFEKNIIANYCGFEEFPFDLAEVMRQTGVGLRTPVSHIAMILKTELVFNKEERCPTPQEVRALIRITTVIDSAIALVLTIMPGAQPLVVAQNVIGPLLTQIADYLQGKSTSVEERQNLIEQIGMMAKASVDQMNNGAQRSLREVPGGNAKKMQKPALPKFYFEKGVVKGLTNVGGTKIRATLLEEGGKVYAEVPTKNGVTAKHEVFYSYASKTWQLSGDGKFNRFSRQEQRIATEYGINRHSVGSSEAQGKHYYAVPSPFREGENLVMIEMRGQFVAFSVHPQSGRTFIFNAANPEDALHEVVFTQNEWHLKASPKRLNKIQTLYSPQDGKMLDVAVVRNKKGKQIFAQMDRQAGFFFGPKYKLNEQGQLERVQSKGQSAVKTKGHSVDQSDGVRLKPEGSVKLSGVEEVKVPGVSFSGTVVKRPVEGSPYLQYYATSPTLAKGSETLVVSAHGGFINSDMHSPAVVMPSDLTLKMLTPHGTKLTDPGLDHVVSPNDDFRAYVTFNKGVVSKVDFVPQEGREDWLFPDSYEPDAPSNTQGRPDGILNYRHFRYEGESDEHIGKVLIENRQLAEKGEATLADVVTVSDEISDFGDTDPLSASVQKLIDLDQAGKLLNEKGERYKTIVLSHCRNNFLDADSTISFYEMRSLTERVEPSNGKGTSVGEIGITRLHRERVDQPFVVEHVSAGKYQFVRVYPKPTTTTPSSAIL